MRLAKSTLAIALSLSSIANAQAIQISQIAGHPINCTGTLPKGPVQVQILAGWESTNAKSDISVKGPFGFFGGQKERQSSKDCQQTSLTKIECKSGVSIDLAQAQARETNGIVTSFNVFGTLSSRSDASTLNCDVTRNKAIGDTILLKPTRLEQLGVLELKWITDSEIQFLQCKDQSLKNCEIVGRENGYSFSELQAQTLKVSAALKEVQDKLDHKRDAKIAGQEAAAAGGLAAICLIGAVMGGSCGTPSLGSVARAHDNLERQTPREQAQILGDVDLAAVGRLVKAISQIQAAAPGSTIDTDVRLDHVVGYVTKFMN